MPCGEVAKAGFGAGERLVGVVELASLACDYISLIVNIMRTIDEGVVLGDSAQHLLAVATDDGRWSALHQSFHFTTVDVCDLATLIEAVAYQEVFSLLLVVGV
jgi:hypothetical protein